MKFLRILNDANRITNPNSDYYTFKFMIEGKPILPLNNPVPSGTGLKLMDGNNFMVRGWIDQDTFVETTKSIYEPIVATGSTNIEKLMVTIGAGSFKSRKVKRKIWSDTEAQVFTFDLFFQAERDGEMDVVAPIRNLQSLCLPLDTFNDATTGETKTQFFLVPPSQPLVTSTVLRTVIQSAIADITNRSPAFKNILREVQIGNFIKLRNIIIESAEVRWDIQNVDIKGNPLSAKVSVNLMAADCWVQGTIFSLLTKRYDEDYLQEIDIDDVWKETGLKKIFG